MKDIYEENSQLFSPQAIAQKEYWKNKLSGDIIKTEIQFNHITDGNKRLKRETCDFFLPDSICTQVGKLGRHADISIYIILLAALKVLIYRYTSNADISVISPVYQARTTSRTLNQFVIIRNLIQGDMTFKDLILEVRQAVLEAYENQDYPFADLCEFLFNQKINTNPVSNITCLLNTLHDEDNIDQLNSKLFFFFKRKEERIEGSIVYDSNLYKKEHIDTLLRHFENALHALARVKEKIATIRILAKEEKVRLLHKFNNNKAGFSRDKSVCRLFEEHESKNPHRMALIYENLHLTYRELNERVNRLAGRLQNMDIKKEQLVGILLERSPEMVVSILATWKLAGGYIPIDPMEPTHKIITILKDSQIKLLYSKTIYIETDLADEYREKIVYLDKPDFIVDREIPKKVLSQIDMNSTAYVIYTSGSAGLPKGVMIEHLGMMNHIQAKINDLQMSARSIIAQNASHTFDISVWQFFAVLTIGGRLVIFKDESVLMPAEFISQSAAQQITHLEVVPSYLSLLLKFAEVKPGGLRNLNYIIVTGEELIPRLVKSWFEKYPEIKMVNAYGPTEASDDITHHLMEKNSYGNEKIPIGKPVQNFNIYILDENIELCPVGIKGEICVSGVGVGRGYLNNVEKTQHVFLRNPFPGKNDEKLYKTGDLGCWHPDGIIDFYGRKDYQVKIRGFRIELKEIEHRLLEIEWIKDAVVMDKEDESGDKYLCGYIVSEKEVEVSEIRKALSKKIPEYMIPAFFVQLDEIPLTANGKVNRKSLPAPESQKANKYVPPGTEIEERLANMWSMVLKRDKTKIGINENFFELGGHSLNATILIAEIYQQLGVRVPLIEVFKRSTIKSLGSFIETIKNMHDQKESITNEREEVLI